MTGRCVRLNEREMKMKRGRKGDDVITLFSAMSLKFFAKGRSFCICGGAKPQTRSLREGGWRRLGYVYSAPCVCVCECDKELSEDANKAKQEMETYLISQQ